MFPQKEGKQLPSASPQKSIPASRMTQLNRTLAASAGRTGVSHQILDHPPKLGLPFLGNLPPSLKRQRTKHLAEVVTFSSFNKKYYTSFKNASNKRKLVEIVLYARVSI